jgi:hypothetical protein
MRSLDAARCPLLVAVLTMTSICFSSIGLAQAPDSLSFQGFVTDTLGLPIDTPGVSITFKLYEGIAEIWSETQPSVKIDRGVFNVLLGSVTPLNTVRFDRPLSLGIKVGLDPEISPRTPLAAAAYAKALPGLYTFYYDDGGDRSHNVVGGGANNIVGPEIVGATISGGGGVYSNQQGPNSVLRNFGTVGGGILNTADGERATVGGGLKNTAAGHDATVAGGQLNSASGRASTVPGGLNNRAAGHNSFAAGFQAKAIHSGSFVWNDLSRLANTDTLVTTGDNQFLIRAAGGVGIGTNEPNSQLSIVGTTDMSDSLAIGTAAPSHDLTVVGNANISERLGIGTSNLEAPLHVQVNDLDVGAGEKAREGVLLEKNDAVIGVYSDDGGNWGSAVVLAEMNNDLLSSKWAMVRSTQGNGNDLHFKYGTSSLYENNSTRFEITNDGRIISYGIRPFSDNGGTSGDPSFRWTDVYATNGVTTTSDRRLKQDIEDLDNGLLLLSALRPVRYRWKSDKTGGTNLGLIAQEVELIVPEVVRAPENDSEHYGVNYAELVPLLISAIQDQQATIEAQEREIQALRTVDSDYDGRLAALEARLQP